MIEEGLAGAEIAVIGGGRASLGAFGEVFLGLILGAAPRVQTVRVLGLSRPAVARLARRLGDRRVVGDERPARGTAAIVYLGVSGALARQPARIGALFSGADAALAATRAVPGAAVIVAESVLASGGALAFGGAAERAFYDRIAARGQRGGAVGGAGPMRWRAESLGFAAAGAWAQAVVAEQFATYVGAARLTRVRMPLLEPALSLPEPGFCGRGTALAPLVWALGAGKLGVLPCEGRLGVAALPLDVAAGALVAIVGRAVAEKHAAAYALAGEGPSALSWARLVELTNLAARPRSGARGWERIRESFLASEARVVPPATPVLPSDGPYEPAPPGVTGAARALVERYSDILTRGFPTATAAERDALARLGERLAPSERALLGLAVDWRKYWLTALYPGLGARVFPRFERRARRRAAAMTLAGESKR